VRPEESSRDIVRIIVAIDMLVVPPVIGGPVEHRVLKGTGPENESEELHRPGCLEREMGEEPMVAERDTEAGGDHKEEEHPPDKPINSMMPQIDGSPDQGQKGDADEKGSVDPVNTPVGNTEGHDKKGLVGHGCVSINDQPYPSSTDWPVRSLHMMIIQLRLGIFPRITGFSPRNEDIFIPPAEKGNHGGAGTLLP